MESDDDYQTFSPPEEPSSPIHQRKLKRLKKAVVSQSMDQGTSKITSRSAPDLDHEPSETLDADCFDVEGKDSFGDFSAASEEFCFESEGLMNELRAEIGVLKKEESRTKSPNIDGGEDHESRKTLDINSLVNAVRPVLGSADFDCEGDSDGKDDESLVQQDELRGERVVNEEDEDTFGDLDAADEDFDSRDGLINELRAEIGISRKEETEKKIYGSEEGDEKIKKNKKKGKRAGDNARPEERPPTKRRIEKERKMHLEQLHAESQRLLRETRGVSFKQVPIIKKPISSVLEKIRQRKLEVLRMSSSYADSNESLEDTMLDSRAKNEKTEKEGGEKHPEEVDKDVPPVNENSSHLGAADLNMASDPCSRPPENVLRDMALDEESENEFPSPVNRIQDGSNDSEPINGDDVQLEDQVDSPLEEVLAPSSLTMNLKLGSTPPEDISSDDEDSEKENVVPHPHKLGSSESYPKGDPVKAFVDDEAEEEDDSDNDLMRFHEDEEDEDNEASEEFNDLIVTGYKEKPIDNERRDQLHQTWLEKQDAAATDDLLQRLKCGPKQREVSMLDEDEKYEESDDDSADEAADHLYPNDIARINCKKVKQMIPHMFTDKDDTYISDEEETEQKLVRQLFVEKAGGKTSFLSPAEDESSREVFDLIKKVNIPPDTKKKAKQPSIFDMLISGNSNSSSKSSFLGRARNNSMSGSRNHGSSTGRSYIFGRDDSNSRSEITAEVSSDTVEKETRTIRTASAKFSSSQSKCSTQNTITSSRSSLLDILRRSTEQAKHSTQTTTVSQSETVVQVSAFMKNLGNKSIKIERRR